MIELLLIDLVCNNYSTYHSVRNSAGCNFREFRNKVGLVIFNMGKYKMAAAAVVLSAIFTCS